MIKWRKPHIYKILRAFDKGGQTCWEMEEKVFDRLFRGLEAFEINGQISGNLGYGQSEVIVFRVKAKGDIKSTST